ncbi:pyocin knob domain-containing protein [Saccharibacillus sacchari]|uniref:Pyocin knob domain-containing protein n=1 Tax=Saccharibacillus sacchari TaxID=456493 RepID=A0ACC6PI52_9BACL
MSSKTPNINLHKADKVADADQTFNIDTLLNENWDKLDTAIGEMRTEIGEIEPEIPDASTTQKGLVQLDDTTSSTSKGKAATADAVRRAKDEATWAAVGVKDTRNVNAAPSTYVQGLTREFKVGAAIGLDGQTHVLLETHKPWMDVSGGVVHQIGFGGTTGTLYRRTGKEDATGWNGWVEQIHSGYPWQKHKLTEDNGLSLIISGQNLNDIKKVGFYNGSSVVNAPNTDWYHFEVQVHPNTKDYYIVQIARNMFTNTYQQRICTANSWGPWTEDLFQSVANGKASLKTAISGKGGTVSQAGSTPTFAELVTGVNSVQRAERFSGGLQYGAEVASGSSTTIATLPTISRYLSLVGLRNPGIYIYTNYNAAGYINLYLFDSAGTSIFLFQTVNAGQGMTALFIDATQRTVQFRFATNADMAGAVVPANFRFDGPIRIVVVNNSQAPGRWQGDWIGIYG